MSHYLLHEIAGNHFLLCCDRYLYWEEEKALVLSDLHLGKSGHFRKHGIGIPQDVFKEDMQRLLSAIQLYKAEKVIVVGDMFHSHANKEHALFLKWRNDIPHIAFHLVVGNHDILSLKWYKEANLQLHYHELELGNFIFTHDINDASEKEGKYYFSGHIHPCVRLQGLGRQSVHLPCFYFSKTFAVLPAFGKFTGTYPVKIKPEDNVFALAEDKLVKVQ
ncbi:MAG: ligase-associated DNA damage response endonuclease PdeM [Sphingobacteriales bacterium]|nr:MAG: ligase-associated DNA damage response endonuclease PdeM [Sphingobacteriales bacterium]